MNNHRNAVVLDDHKLFSLAWACLLKETNCFNNTICAQSIDEVKQLLVKGESTHLFIDYMMPQVNTLAEIAGIRAGYPGIFIIVVSSLTNTNVMAHLQKEGANAFISKTSERHEIEECLCAIENGRFFMSADVRSIMTNNVQRTRRALFTPREYEILKYIASGKTIEQTALNLFLSKHTIVSHRRNMMEKMGVNSATALLKKAVESGMI
ncbi:MAG: response regulator transcription factor [Chitinophagaceae bacterium]|nr:response regulator transcription factor [Chitinophagaceae bacterium]